MTKLEASSRQVEQNEEDLQIEEKKKVINAPPFNWPWFERFDNIFLVLPK